MIFSGPAKRRDIPDDTSPSVLSAQSAADLALPYNPLGARTSAIPTMLYGNMKSGFDDSPGFTDDDMRYMLIEQATIYRVKEIGTTDSPSPDTCDGQSVRRPRFVVFRLPYLGSEPGAWEDGRQSSSSAQYLSTYDPHILAEVPLGTLLPDGVLSCRPCLICCTDLGSWLRPIDLLRQLLEQAWCAAELEPSFRAPFPLSRVQIEDIRVAYERTVVPDLARQGVSMWGTFSDDERIRFKSFSLLKPATSGVVRRLPTDPVAISGHQSIDAGLSLRPKLSPSTSLATSGSLASFATARSTHDEPAFTSPSGYCTTNTVESVRENERPAPRLSALLAKIHEDYYTVLRQEKIIQPFDKELNWSGKGQHVTFTAQDAVPLTLISHLGSSLSAIVEKVLCRRVALARKTMRCNQRWTVADALREVHHLQNLRHVHIVQLVGTYLQSRNFSILMYPAADSHLGTFLEETTDMQDTCRKDFLASTLGCLVSAVAFIHERTTKHMDIKPRNILVRSDGSWWRIYLTDFGLSRSFAPQDHSQTDGWTSRTIRYCSPEVFNYAPRGRAADVFSLGCVFLEITCVIAKIDLQDFIDARRGDSEDISFHANLDRVVKWARTSLRSSLLLSQGSNPEPRALEKVIGLQVKMISHEPSMRPTAAEVRSRLASFPRSAFSPTTCCSSPPEPYEVYKPISPVS
jgi:serine/threonine protein kinase